MCSKINHRYAMGVDIHKELDDDNLCILAPEQEIQKLLSRFHKGQSRPGDQHYIKLLTKKVTGQITWPGDKNIKSNFFSSQLQWIEFSKQPKNLQLAIKHFLLTMPIFQGANNRQHCLWLQNKLAVYMQKKRVPKQAISDSYYRATAAVPFGHPDGLVPPTVAAPFEYHETYEQRFLQSQQQQQEYAYIAEAMRRSMTDL